MVRPFGKQGMEQDAHTKRDEQRPQDNPNQNKACKLQISPGKKKARHQVINAKIAHACLAHKIYKGGC